MRPSTSLEALEYSRFCNRYGIITSDRASFLYFIALVDPPTFSFSCGGANDERERTRRRRRWPICGRSGAGKRHVPAYSSSRAHAKVVRRSSCPHSPGKVCDENLKLYYLEGRHAQQGLIRRGTAGSPVTLIRQIGLLFDPPAVAPFGPFDPFFRSRQSFRTLSREALPTRPSRPDRCTW